MRVESSCCFYPILGRSHIFSGANYCRQQSIKGEEWRFTTNEGVGINVTEPYLGRGGRDHVKFIVTQPKSVSSDPSLRPWHLKHSHPVGKNIIVLGGITHSRVAFNSLENLFPAQVSVKRRTESHKKQSNTTQQNETEMVTN